MKILPERRVSWPLLGLLALAMLAGLGTFFFKYYPSLVSTRLVTVTSPEVVTPGETFFIEVQVTNRKNNRPLPGGRAAVVALSPVMDAAGGKAETEWVAINADGNARLPVVLDSHLGRGEGIYLVRVENGWGDAGDMVSGVVAFDHEYAGTPPAPIHIVTDKPLYQPGQTIRFAVLAMNQKYLQPLSEEPVVVTVFDGRGNQVDRQELVSSENGIAAGTVPLSSDPNPGEWRIRAQAGAYRREIGVTVKRYVRRRMEIRDNLSSAYFSPGKTTTATFDITYFNGKPATGVAVTLKMTCPDLFGKPYSFSATTDSNGRAAFTLSPLGQRRDKDTTVMLEAVVDDGGSPEKWKREVAFYSQPIRLAILPEAGHVRANTENRLLLSAWNPDGSPAPGAYRVTRRMSKAVIINDTITVGEKGWSEFTVDTGSATFSLDITGEGVPADSQFTFSPVTDLGIAPRTGDWRPGGIVEGEVFFHNPGGATPKRVELALALPGGAVEPVPLTQTSEGVWSFAAPIPRQAQGDVVLFASVHTNNRLSHTRRITLPISASIPEISVTPRPLRVGPREKVTLDLQMTRPIDTGKEKSGAAVVTIADASILARANGATAEGIARAYIESRQTAAAMPPPITKAFADGSLPFLAIPVEVKAVRGSDNLSTLQHQEWKRVRAWSAVSVSVFIAFGLAWVFVLYTEASERDKHRQVKQVPHFGLIEFLIVVAIIAIIAAIATPNLMQARTAGDPGSRVSPEERDRAVTRSGVIASDSIVSQDVVREWFPETLAFFPEVPFDSDGLARIEVETADNLTRWHAGAVGIAAAGGLRTGGTDFWTEKPFFLEADFPVAFIVGDQPDLRVALFHTIDFATAEIVLDDSDAYVCDEKRIEVDRRRLTENQWFVFSPRFIRPGEARVGLTAIARNADGAVVAKDAFSMPVTVTARGRETTAHSSGVLSDNSVATANLPLSEAAINKRYELRVYPTPLSEYLDGAEALLRIPTGCFEQTASANYPNIFVLEYLKKNPNADPEMISTATDYVRQGYQRLLGFEVPGGGFSLYGRAPASPWLTAYGLMHFHDLERVIHVDPDVIRRTREYLERMKLAGEPGAYAAWAIMETGGRQSFHVMETAEKSILPHESAYTRLTGALSLLVVNPEHSRARAVIEHEMDSLANGLPKKSPKLPSSARGLGSETELIALAIMAGQRAGLAVPGTLYEELGRRRSARGGWPGTQATTMALKALTGARMEPCDGILIVSSRGVELSRHRIDDDARHFTLGQPLADTMQLRYEGVGRLSYLVSAHGDMRWSDEEMHLEREGLNLRAALDRAEAAVGEEIVMTVNLNDRGDGVENPILEIGLGAAFTVNISAVEELVANPQSRILRYEVRNNGGVLYLASLPAGGRQSLRIPLTATRAGRYTLPATRVWEYYRPENADEAAGMEVIIH